ncbi:MAG: hypothetical protein ACREN4_07915 [Candidatus Dormibacteria bacterium]
MPAQCPVCGEALPDGVITRPQPPPLAPTGVPLHPEVVAPAQRVPRQPAA